MTDSEHQLTYEWKKKFDRKTKKVFIESLSTLITEQGAMKLVEVAGIYAKNDWMRILIGKNGNNDVAAILALYFEPIHGSHEGWICVNPKFRKLGYGDKLFQEFDRTAFENGVRIFRADATMTYTHAQKYLYKRGYKAIGYTPMSFSFLNEKSMGSAVTIWKIMDPNLKARYKEEKNVSLNWEDQRWKAIRPHPEQETNEFEFYW